MLGNIGPMELFIVMVIVLILFGAKRLPQLGSSLGQGIRDFKRSLEGNAAPETSLPPASPASTETPVREMQRLTGR